MGTQGLRADAAHNRERILAVARELLAERGADVPMDEVARRAGVGIATLYRRFPTRESLVQAGMVDIMEGFGAAITEAKEAEDAAGAFLALIERARRLQMTHRGFSDAMCRDAPGFEEMKQRLHEDLLVIVGRATRAGLLREDFAPLDFMGIMLGHAGLIAGACEGDDVDAFSRRYMAVQLAGYAPGGPELPAAPGWR